MVPIIMHSKYRYIAANTLANECYIEVAGRKRMVRLYYTPGIKNAWIMTDGNG